MKNQPFHQRKIKLQEAPKLDFDQLRARTINALNKLGQQKFSTEPGGYALENWTKGLNVLLDEFEEKAGTARLSSEYLTSRRELTGRLASPTSTASTDEEMLKLRANISDIEDKIDAERTRLASRISELKAAQEKCTGELQQERVLAAVGPSEQSPGSIVSRLLGRRKAQIKSPESRIRELETKQANLQKESLEQQKQLKRINFHSPESRFSEEWSQAESLRAKLSELEKEKSEKVQLVKEREQMTALIAESISRIR